MSKELKIVVFAKKRNTNDGRIFFTYLSTLTRSDNSTFTVQVKFKGDDKNRPRAEECPMNVIVDRETANLTKKVLADENGEVFDSYTLWVSKWKQGEPYVDHSLDDII